MKSLLVPMSPARPKMKAPMHRQLLLPWVNRAGMAFPSRKEHLKVGELLVQFGAEPSSL